MLAGTSSVGLPTSRSYLPSGWRTRTRTGRVTRSDQRGGRPCPRFSHMEPPRCDAGHGRRDAAPVITSERGGSRIPPPVTQGGLPGGEDSGGPLRPRLVRCQAVRRQCRLSWTGRSGVGMQRRACRRSRPVSLWRSCGSWREPRGGQRLPVQSDRCDWRPLLIGNVSICPSRQGGSTSGPLIATNGRPAAADHHWTVTRAGRMCLVMLLKRRTGTSAVSADMSRRPTSSR